MGGYIRSRTLVDDYISTNLHKCSLKMQITVYAHTVLCFAWCKLSFPLSREFPCSIAAQSSAALYTGHEFFGDEWRISSSIYDSPAYFGTLDSSMDQKQWSKANTCGGDSTGSVTTHFSHLSKHVQYNTTWYFLVVVLLLQWYKNRLTVLYHTVNQQDWACPCE